LTKIVGDEVGEYFVNRNRNGEVGVKLWHGIGGPGFEEKVLKMSRKMGGEANNRGYRADHNAYCISTPQFVFSFDFHDLFGKG
jgi:hypothetical protein